MASFGDLRNSLELLRKYFQKMNIYDQMKIRKNEVEENFFKKNNPDIFLKLTHFLIVEYSPAFYLQVLQTIPTISSTNDRKFIENTLSYTRKVLGMNPQITVDQFLSNNFLQKKTEFLATLCNKVYELDCELTRNVKDCRPLKQSILSKCKEDGLDSNDPGDEDLMPRQIKVKPSENVFGKAAKEDAIRGKLSKIMEDVSYVQDQIQSKRTQLLNISKTKPNVFPKNISKYGSSDEEEDHPCMNATSKVQPKKSAPPSQQQQGGRDYSVDYVTREQFNETLSMLANMNQTITKMADKFNSFQESVTGWVNNVNAKVSILESNVKMIKDNL